MLVLNVMAYPPHNTPIQTRHNHLSYIYISEIIVGNLIVFRKNKNPAPDRKRGFGLKGYVFWGFSPELRTLNELINYPKSPSTCCGAMFAWASMAVPACIRIWLLVKDDISMAMSTSRMVDSAADVFSMVVARFAAA